MIFLFDHDKGTYIAILEACSTHPLEIMETYLNKSRQAKKSLLLLQHTFNEDLHQISHTLTMMVTHPLVSFQKSSSFYRRQMQFPLHWNVHQPDVVCPNHSRIHISLDIRHFLGEQPVRHHSVAQYMAWRR